MKKVLSILGMSLLIFGQACKKDSKESRMFMITAGTWRMVAFTVDPGYDYDGDGDIDTDIFAVTDQCEKDNIFLFKETGALEINEGSTRCAVTDPQVYFADWEFSNGERDIIIAGEEFHIDELSQSRLKISQDDNGDKSVITFSR